jgi:putative Mg2+ transporter-C (MgtC) family protein
MVIGSKWVMDQFSIVMITRLIIAALLGGILGIEREKHGRPAGFRTHRLVSPGSAACMILSPIVAGFMSDPHGDPGRIAAQIVSGIGFLGAGAIVKEGDNIHGLTTAVCLWIAAAIGMTTGASQLVDVGAITIIALFTLLLLPRLEPVLKRHTYKVLELSTALDEDVDQIPAVLLNHKAKILRTDFACDYQENKLKISFLVRLYEREITNQDVINILQDIENLEISPLRIVWQTR